MPGQRRRRTIAQAMVEFALALPILLLVMYGLIEAGRLLFMYASVVSASRQAVRYGSVTGDNGSGTPYYRDCAGIRDSAKRLGFLQRFQDSDILISYDTGPGGASIGGNDCVVAAGHPVNGDRIRVQVSTEYSPIVPLVPFDPFTITSAGIRTLLVGISVQVQNPGVVLPPGSSSSAIGIRKESTPTSYDHEGENITYHYTVTNLSTNPAENLTVNDSLGIAVSCGNQTIPPAGSVLCSASYTILQADIDRGTVTNIATATADVLGTPAIAQTSLTINFVPRPKLLLTKSGVPPDIVARGQDIIYTFTLKNDGNVRLTAPFTIIDPKLDSWTCAGAGTDLPVNGTTECTGRHAITNNDINSTRVENTATATAKYGDYTVTSNSAPATVLVPELLLALSADPGTVSDLGVPVTIKYELWNRTSNKTMTNIKVNDDRGASNLLCVTSLGPGGYGSCTRTYTGYTQADRDVGKFTITASAAAQGGYNSNADDFTVFITQNIKLTLTKQGSTSQQTTIPATINYTYLFKNDGNVTLKAPYTITDDRLPGVTCTGIPSSLAPGATFTCPAVSYSVKQTDLDAGSIINKARATATVTMPAGTTTTQSNEATWTVITFLGQRLGIYKTSDPTFFQTAGQTIAYTYRLQNTGGQPLPGPYSVDDSMIPGGVNCSTANNTVPSIPIGGSVSCTGSYETSPADFTAGSVTNTATGTAGSVASTLPSPATLEIKKFSCSTATLWHGDPTPIADGKDISWTIINNTGIPVHIASITITWNSAPPNLTQIKLGASSIWSGNTGYGGFIVPGGPWNLGNGNTNMALSFSGEASGVRIILTFNEAGCPSVDSNAVRGT